MTNEQIESILARALADEGFLTKLVSDPADTAKTLGVTLTAEEASTLRGMSADEFRAFASDYQSATDPAKRRAAC